MRQITVIAHNLRSSHNIGSLLRTADGLGVTEVILSGYTPYPVYDGDNRLPHLAAKTHKQIAKTALGAESTVKWRRTDDIVALIRELQANGVPVAAIEQAPASTALNQWRAPKRIAILVGREVEGIEPEVLALCDAIIEIPMFGSKESFNVVQAAAMALYELRFHA